MGEGEKGLGERESESVERENGGGCDGGGGGEEEEGQRGRERGARLGGRRKGRGGV